MRRPVKDRDALDLVREWLACNRAEIAVIELAHLAGTQTTWRATLRTALGRTASHLSITPAAALRATYDELGYVRVGEDIEIRRDPLRQIA